MEKGGAGMSVLASPIRVGNLEINNRLVLPPMATAKSTENGEVTDALCAYYAEKSTGGSLGLIITEHSFVHPRGQASAGQLSIAKDSDIAGLKKLTTVIHQNQTKAFAQISHAGGLAKQAIIGAEPLSASATVFPKVSRAEGIPKQMTVKDIQHVISAFVAAAVRAKEAGFDGVELHSAHGYLLNQFYSPLINKRRDAYRGDQISGRIKLHLEIIRGIQKQVGKDFPIAVRLGASDYLPGGTTIEDSVIAAKAFEEAGVCLIDVSGGFSFYTHPHTKKQGYFCDLSEVLKKSVHIPVILTGGVVTASAAEDLLVSNKADMIGVGRAILKDSNWASEALAALE